MRWRWQYKPPSWARRRAKGARRTRNSGQADLASVMDACKGAGEMHGAVTSHSRADCVRMASLVHGKLLPWLVLWRHAGAPRLCLGVEKVPRMTHHDCLALLTGAGCALLVLDFGCPYRPNQMPVTPIGHRTPRRGGHTTGDLPLSVDARAAQGCPLARWGPRLLTHVVPSSAPPRAAKFTVADMDAGVC